MLQVIEKSLSRSFFISMVGEFLSSDSDAIIGQLASKHVALHSSAEAEQVKAWEVEIDLLKNAFQSLRESTTDWSILLEVSLFRLGKRLDAVVLAPGIVAALEFKIGAGAYLSSARVQLERYALSLKDFHEASQSRLIIPILCAENAPPSTLSITVIDGVADPLMCNGETLVEAFRMVRDAVDPNEISLNATEFDFSAYRPTPTIVEAAQSLYAGHSIADIGRGDAADADLQATAAALGRIADEAAAERKKVVCFVTGAPGAGKTLLGLDLALKNRSGANPAALLSGNRPLVHVLTEALAEDSARRTGQTKTQAKYEADCAIQNLLGYLKEHTEVGTPPEHVIIFDEAQRAWNEDVGQKLMGRPRSEPALFLDILGRLDWCCLVCLVGPGQEINRGEGGLPLWAISIVQASDNGIKWDVIAAPPAIDGGPLVAGAGLASVDGFDRISVRRDERLHLANAIRSYRNPLHGEWVAALLESDISRARNIADKMMGRAPSYITRDLECARSWLRDRRNGDRSAGLLCSSGAVRLIGDGVPPAPRSDELGPIGHWFLKPYTDFRSSGAIETPMSEFGCQGLEVDYSGLCWGGDLIWHDEKWCPRMMRAPRWQVVRDENKKRFRINAYRVLLTRARAGSVIFVPKGAEDDPTRAPLENERTAQVLIDAGCVSLT